MPQIITLMMLALSLISLGTSISDLIQKVPVDEPEEKNQRAALLTLLLLLAYVFLFSVLGFIIDSILYLFLQFCILAPGKRQYVKYLIISVITVVLIYAFFRHVLLLMLPTLFL